MKDSTFYEWDNVKGMANEKDVMYYFFRSFFKEVKQFFFIHQSGFLSDYVGGLYILYPGIISSTVETNLNQEDIEL